MSNPATPTDAQLMKIVGNDPYLLVAIRSLFDQAGTTSPDNIQDAIIASGNAESKANQANALIDKLTTMIELVGLSPRSEQIKEGDTSPRYEYVTQLTMADLAPL